MKLIMENWKRFVDESSEVPKHLAEDIPSDRLTTDQTRGRDYGQRVFDDIIDQGYVAVGTGTPEENEAALRSKISQLAKGKYFKNAPPGLWIGALEGQYIAKS
tara:strand:+ start:193 stop:501 length:309 start_codon:yes stop_codon:yes gene_type:complete